MSGLSLPSWERGLKYLAVMHQMWEQIVAPFMGAWIEIYERIETLGGAAVAPFMGAWIEITYYMRLKNNL